MNKNHHTGYKRNLPIVLIVVSLLSFLISSCTTNRNMGLVDLGNKYFVEHNYEEASKIYEDAIKKGYKTFDVFYNLGCIYYFEKKDLDKAEEIFKKGLLIYPKDSMLHSVLSQLYFEIGNLSDGLREYKLAIKYGGRERINTLPAEMVKEILVKQGKTDKEINGFFKEIIAINPNDYYVLYELAQDNLTNKKYEEALKQYTKISELSPNAVYVYREIGICYFNLGQYDLSLEYLKKAKENGYPVPEEFIQEIGNIKNRK